MSVQLATRVEDEQAALFKETTKRLGTTPADALRMFIATFNSTGGFPYDVRLDEPVSVEPFQAEDEAVEFPDACAEEPVDGARSSDGKAQGGRA